MCLSTVYSVILVCLTCLWLPLMFCSAPCKPWLYNFSYLELCALIGAKLYIAWLLEAKVSTIHLLSATGFYLNERISSWILLLLIWWGFSVQVLANCLPLTCVG
ncbi:hypothetical protein VNO80_25942 [Phaseolus coccineus]|uniref:Uncharacterized protein n=1 Tax=Phaseolus coccineus TaxID=3886 RepID=A0AAN9M094_PHACN